MMESPRKRSKQSHYLSSDSPTWTEANVLSLDGVQYATHIQDGLPTPEQLQNGQLWNASPRNWSLQGTIWNNSFDISMSSSSMCDTPMSDFDDSDVIGHLMPKVVSSSQNRSRQESSSDLVNPFRDTKMNHLPEGFLRTGRLPPDLGVNGYIKFRLGVSPACGPHVAKTPSFDDGCPPTASISVTSRIPRAPQDFGEGFRKDAVERKLWNFYLVGFCSGRTLLKNTNSWYNELAPMGDGSELVHYTILALACTYVYEYLQGESLRQRANEYYARAVDLLGVALANRVDNADEIIGAIALLNMHDIVTYELRRPKDQTPRWLEGARLASKLLYESDPKFKYKREANIQMDSIRLSNITVIARAAIFALPLLPLDPTYSENHFAWILRCDYHETRRIHGASGLSLRLLHMWAQVTYFCLKQSEEPNGIHWPVAMDNIWQRLANFEQWSVIEPDRHVKSDGSLDALLLRCKLNEDGIVGDSASMTMLGGQAWVVALKVYMLCRFYKKPRDHEDVLKAMDELAQCIQRMPTSGDLFTAQIPLLPIFLLGLLSVRKDHRDVAGSWFDGVLSTAVCRSSVDPLWPALQRIWSWIDNVIGPSEDWEVDSRLEDMDPWWERMVNAIVEQEGTLCLI